MQFGFWNRATKHAICVFFILVGWHIGPLRGSILSLWCSTILLARWRWCILPLGRSSIWILWLRRHLANQHGGTTSIAEFYPIGYLVFTARTNQRFDLLF